MARKEIPVITGSQATVDESLVRAQTIVDAVGPFLPQGKVTKEQYKAYMEALRQKAIRQGYLPRP